MPNGDVRAFQNAQATNDALRERVRLLRDVREQTEGIVGLQERGVQQAQEVARASREIADAVGRSEGSVGGGSIDDLMAGVIGLLVGASSAGGGGGGGGREPGFRPGAPSLRGASFARSLALGQFR